MKLFSIALTIAGLLAGAAQATNVLPYPDTEVGDWLIYGSPKYCWMMKRYPDGTDLKFNWIPTKNESYLNLVSAKFGWIDESEYYDLLVSVDDWSEQIEATGRDRKDGTFSVSFFAPDADEFKDLIVAGGTMRVKLDERINGEYSLAGSKAALAELMRCEATLGPVIKREEQE